MPLLDHFHAPLYPRHPWESFHATWAGAIAAALNQTLLPAGYFAEEHAHVGPRIEIDVATFEGDSPDTGPRATDGGSTQTLPAVYAPPAPVVTVPAAFTDEFEIRVFNDEARLVAAIELVSPGNKDRDESRRAFVHKCGGYLAQGIALVVIDVVTSRLANLHAELMAALAAPTGLPDEAVLYAAAYRPVVREKRELIEVWPEPLAVGQAMPTLPLALNAVQCVPIDLEATYTAARGRKRLGA